MTRTVSYQNQNKSAGVFGVLGVLSSKSLLRLVMVLSPLAAEKLPKTNNTKWDENISKLAFLFLMLLDIASILFKYSLLFLDFHFIWSTHTLVLLSLYIF